VDLKTYRAKPAEVERVASLLALVPSKQHTVLDVGARDGYLSIRLAEQGLSVTALDLQVPEVRHDLVSCVRGDVTALQFPDGAFDVVLCAEVLEHLRPETLPAACSELARVALNHVIIGVPYRQDTRVGQTRCVACGRRNPPWGHLNVFDRGSVKRLFPRLTAARIEFVGATEERTNFASSWLMDLAGNPYGTYDQDEPCVHCGARLQPPPPRTLLQKAASRLAVTLDRAQRRLTPVRPNWMHVLLRKRFRPDANLARDKFLE